MLRHRHRRQFSTPIARVLICLGLACFGSALYATTLTWDGDSATPGLQDAGGDWETSSVNHWWSGASYQFWNNANHDSAVFGVTNGMAGLISLKAPIVVQNLTFNYPGSNRYTIKQSNSGLTLTLAAGSVITANADASVQATIAGEGFVKEGDATLTLAGTPSYPNNYLGLTTVNAGTLLLAKSADTAAIPGNLIINSNAVVRLSARNQIVDSANITINHGLFDLAANSETVGTVIMEGGAITATSGVLSSPPAHDFDLRSGSVTAKLSGPAGLVKSSSGTLVLTAANNYAGDTVIADGMLALAAGGSVAGSENILVNDGAILAVTNRVDGTLILNSGQTLRGSGVVEGSVTAVAGSTVAPGNSLGALAVHGSLNLLGGSTTVMELNDAGSASDAVVGLSKVVYGGTLIIANRGGDPVDGATFQLFSSATRSGSFTNVIWPPLPAGLVWNDSLALDGSINVVGANLPALPRFLSISRGGGAGVVLAYTGPTGQDYRLWAGPSPALIPATNFFDVLTEGVFTGDSEVYLDVDSVGSTQRIYFITSP